MTGASHTSYMIDIVAECTKHSIIKVMRYVMSRCTCKQYQQLSACPATWLPIMRPQIMRTGQAGRIRGPGVVNPVRRARGPPGAKIGDRSPAAPFPLNIPEKPSGCGPGFFSETIAGTWRRLTWWLR